MHHITRKKTACGCATRHRHGEEVPNTQLQIVTLGRRHGETISTTSAKSLLHQGGLWLPRQGHFAVIRPSGPFATHVLNEVSNAALPQALRGLNRRGVVPGGRGPRYASRPIVRSIGLDSSHPFIWETCADGTAKGADGDPKEAACNVAILCCGFLGLSASPPI
jgi:hypothetical protein